MDGGRVERVERAEKCKGPMGVDGNVVMDYGMREGAVNSRPG